MRRGGSIDRSAIACALVLVAGCASLKKCAYEGFGRDERRRIVRPAVRRGQPRSFEVDAGELAGPYELGEAIGRAGRELVALDDEKAVTAVAFLRRAVAHFAALGIRVERLMTDNGNAYRSAIHALACKALGIKHLRTRPYRPRTNGKAERFIRTLLERWAYAYSYANEPERLAALPSTLDFYNRFRPHRALGGLAPLQRVNNLSGTYS